MTIIIISSIKVIIVFEQVKTEGSSNAKMAQTTIEVRLISMQTIKNKLDIVVDLAVNNGGSTYYLTLINHKIRKEMITSLQFFVHYPNNESCFYV